MRQRECENVYAAHVLPSCRSGNRFLKAVNRLRGVMGQRSHRSFSSTEVETNEGGQAIEDGKRGGGFGVMAGRLRTKGQQFVVTEGTNTRTQQQQHHLTTL